MRVLRREGPAALAAVVSGLLLWSVFAPRHETANLALALAPLLLLARLAAPRRAALWFFAGGFTFWFLTLGWMPAIVKNNGPWPLVALGWAGLAALCAGYFALFGWLDARLWARARPRPLGRVAAAFGEAALWAGCEWLRGNLFTGFAWNFLGVAVADGAPALAVPARVGGVYLVSALVVLVNGAFATVVLHVLAPRLKGPFPRRRWSGVLETALPLASILLAAHLAAPGPFAFVARESEAARLRVALVQRNAPCCFRASGREDPFAAFAGLLDVASASRPDLVVLAESAMAEFGGEVAAPRARAAADRMLAAARAGALLAGGDWTVDGRTRNAAALYLTNGAPPQVYAKQHLVPFGEYIPLDKWITPLQKLSPVGVSLHPGEPRLLELPLADGRTVKVAPLICYEDTVPALARRAAAMGADLIALITNDSWFSRSAEAEQHAAHSLLRAVETGLPIVRTGNSGVTGAVTPLGGRQWLDDGGGRPLVDAPGSLSVALNVRLSPPPTPYVRLGDAPLWACFALALAFALAPRRRGEEGA